MTENGGFFVRFDDTQEAVQVERPNVLYIRWSRKGCGFGTLTVSVSENGALEIDDEAMGPEFVKEVIGLLVDQAFAKVTPC